MQRSLAQRVAYACLRFTCRITGVLVFGLQCLGRHHIPRSGGALVCSNHQSVMDPVLVGLICNRRLNYLARRTLFHNVAFGWFIRFLDAIPIDRDGLGLDGLKETIRRLRRGEMVLIFPEGTRTTDGRMGRLKPGLCAVARRSQAGLLPVGIAGAFEAWPRRARLPRPRRIVLQVGPLITAEQVAALSNEQLMEELERRMRWCHARAEQLLRGTAADE
jgi:1-acyl-sn-glycerol-3-phosphate acyltransferase